MGDGKVLLSGDTNGRVYPQWWGAVAYRGSPSELAGGMVDADAAIQSAVWAAQLPVPVAPGASLDFGSAHLPAVVFLPQGVYSIGAPIELPDHASLIGAGSGSTHLIANSSTKPPAMIAPPAHGANRTDGWRLSGFSLQGLGRDAGGNGLYLIQTSRAVISDIGIAHFTNGLHLNGASLSCKNFDCDHCYRADILCQNASKLIKYGTNDWQSLCQKRGCERIYRRVERWI